MANRWGNNGNSDRLYFRGLQNHCRWWLKPWNSKMFAPWKKRTDLDSILKSRDITLPTNIHLVKAMFFPVVMYGCESWTIKKAASRRIDAFELWCWRRLLRVPWTARRSNWSFLKEISPRCKLQELVMPSNHSPPTFNLSQHQGFFLMSRLFASGGQSIGTLASASVLPVKI